MLRTRPRSRGHCPDPSPEVGPGSVRAAPASLPSVRGRDPARVGARPRPALGASPDATRTGPLPESPSERERRPAEDATRAGRHPLRRTPPGPDGTPCGGRHPGRTAPRGKDATRAGRHHVERAPSWSRDQRPVGRAPFRVPALVTGVPRSGGACAGPPFKASPDARTVRLPGRTAPCGEGTVRVPRSGGRLRRCAGVPVGAGPDGREGRFPVSSSGGSRACGEDAVPGDRGPAWAVRALSPGWVRAPWGPFPGPTPGCVPTTCGAVVPRAPLGTRWGQVTALRGLRFAVAR